MKFIGNGIGQVGLLLAASILVSSCNKDEYFPTEEMIAGVDAYCSRAPDLASCEQITACQPAFTMPADENAEPVYEACVANREIFFPPEDDGSTGGTVDGSTDGSSDGSSSSSDGSVDGSTDGSSSSSDGSVDGSTDSSSSSSDGSVDGSTDSSSASSSSSSDGSTGGSTGGDPVIDPTIPTIKEAYEANCTNVHPQDLYVVQAVKKGKVVGGMSKVKVCHLTGNGSSHTVLIACPALKAHIKHHDDYIGACSL